MNVAVLLPIVGLLVSSSGQAEPGDPYLAGLGDMVTVVRTVAVDLNDDGNPERATCWTTHDGQHGGLLVVEMRADGPHRLAHVALRDAPCTTVAGDGHDILLSTRSKSRGDVVHRVTPAMLEATSVPRVTATTSQTTHTALNAVDGSLATSWADNVGTGIGERLVLQFDDPVAVAFLAVVGGRNDAVGSFVAHNRPHRIDITVRSAQEMSALRSLPLLRENDERMGARRQMTLQDRPSLTLLHIDAPHTTEIELRIDSVFLGTHVDDTHIADVHVVPWWTPPVPTANVVATLPARTDTTHHATSTVRPPRALLDGAGDRLQALSRVAEAEAEAEAEEGFDAPATAMPFGETEEAEEAE